MSDSILPPTSRTVDLDVYDAKFRGLAMPLVKKPRGYFQTSGSRDLIRSSIYSILTTRKGERVFVPDFGSDLWRLVFEPMDSVTKKLIQRAVTEDITKWERRVQVTSVKVVSDDNVVSLSVEYRISPSTTVEELTVQFSQNNYQTATE